VSYKVLGSSLARTCMFSFLVSTKNLIPRVVKKGRLDDSKLAVFLQVFFSLGFDGVLFAVLFSHLYLRIHGVMILRLFII